MAVAVNIRRRRIDNNYNSISTVYSVGGGGKTIHREFAKLYGGINIVSRDINITFGVPFTNTPVGWYEIYRLRPRNGEWIKSTVRHSYPVEDFESKTNLQITIDPSESLEGIIFKYHYTE